MYSQLATCFGVLFYTFVYSKNSVYRYYQYVDKYLVIIYTVKTIGVPSSSVPPLLGTSPTASPSFMIALWCFCTSARASLDHRQKIDLEKKIVSRFCRRLSRYLTVALNFVRRILTVFCRLGLHLKFAINRCTQDFALFGCLGIPYSLAIGNCHKLKKYTQKEKIPCIAVHGGWFLYRKYRDS